MAQITKIDYKLYDNISEKKDPDENEAVVDVLTRGATMPFIKQASAYLKWVLKDGSSDVELAYPDEFTGYTKILIPRKNSMVYEVYRSVGSKYVELSIWDEGDPSSHTERVIALSSSELFKLEKIIQEWVSTNNVKKFNKSITAMYANYTSEVFERRV